MDYATTNLVIRVICPLALFFGIIDLLRALSQVNLRYIVIFSSLIAITFIIGVGAIRSRPQESEPIIQILQKKMLSFGSAIFSIIPKLKQKIDGIILRIRLDEDSAYPPFSPISIKQDRDDFDNSFSIISRNANFILIGNGTLVALFLAFFNDRADEPVTKLVNLSSGESIGNLHCVSGSAIIQVTEPNSFGIADLGLFSLLIGAISFSIIYCVRVINSGLYPRLKNRDVPLKELEKREEIAITHYAGALFAFVNSILIVVALAGVIFLNHMLNNTFISYTVAYAVVFAGLGGSYVIYRLEMRNLFLGP